MNKLKELKKAANRNKKKCFTLAIVFAIVSIIIISIVVITKDYNVKAMLLALSLPCCVLGAVNVSKFIMYDKLDNGIYEKDTKDAKFNIFAMGYYKVTHEGEFSYINQEDSTREEICYGEENIKESVTFMEGWKLLELIQQHLNKVFNVDIRDNVVVFEYFNADNGTDSREVYKIEEVEKKENK